MALVLCLGLGASPASAQWRGAIVRARATPNLVGTWNGDLTSPDGGGLDFHFEIESQRGAQVAGRIEGLQIRGTVNAMGEFRADSRATVSRFIGRVTARWWTLNGRLSPDGQTLSGTMTVTTAHPNGTREVYAFRFDTTRG